MKLFYVDQYGKVQEFNGTEEEKMQLARARNLYTREEDAHMVTLGDKRRMPYSAFVGSPAPIDMWIVDGPFMYVRQLGTKGLDINTDNIARYRNSGNLFETEEAARAAATKLRKVLKDESIREYYELHIQPTQTQCGNSQAQSSCERTTSNNGCRCHEQSRPCSQGRMQVTVIEMFL